MTANKLLKTSKKEKLEREILKIEKENSYFFRSFFETTKTILQSRARNILPKKCE